MYSLNCCSWAPANSTDHLHFTLYLSPSSPSAHSVLHSVIAIYFVSFYRNDCINSCFLIDCQHIWEAKSSAYPSQSHINHRVVFFFKFSNLSLMNCCLWKGSCQGQWALGLKSLLPVLEFLLPYPDRHKCCWFPAPLNPDWFFSLEHCISPPKLPPK